MFDCLLFNSDGKADLSAFSSNLQVMTLTASVYNDSEDDDMNGMRHPLQLVTLPALTELVIHIKNHGDRYGTIQCQITTFKFAEVAEAFRWLNRWARLVVHSQTEIRFRPLSG